jgi:hypothetical protein
MSSLCTAILTPAIEKVQIMSAVALTSVDLIRPFRCALTPQLTPSRSVDLATVRGAV